jgi:glycosyltransferase involved in cell wall biosynthesis
MNVVMMTNTYAPHTGGVARSVEWFSDALRQLGHHVLVVAPSFPEAGLDEENVIRLPAIQHFNGSDFSVRLPIPGLLGGVLDAFHPDLVHAHHPFLLGDTALRVAALRNLPVIFTHHTMYEQYTHYVPGDSPVMQRFAIRLATEFANLCDHVVAPSQSIARLLRERGVTSDMTAIPTGIDTRQFARGDGELARHKYGVPAGTYVVGHVGRLAPEKNLVFLARAVCGFLATRPDARFLLVGEGPSLDEIRQIAARKQVAGQLCYRDGALKGQELIDAYHAMDVFAFASHSETQGLVLAEAMASGVPVVAVDAPGAREVVRDGLNGRLLAADDEAAFVQALSWCASRTRSEREKLLRAVRHTAARFAMSRCARRLEAVYRQVLSGSVQTRPHDDTEWAALLRLVNEQWCILSGVAAAVGDSLFGIESRGQTLR